MPTRRKPDVIVALGGDGFMLQTLHTTMNTGKRVYGMNRGSIGFLMNRYDPKDLPDAHRGRGGKRLPAAGDGDQAMRAALSAGRWRSTRSTCSASPTRRRSCA
jgi:hypothetical protein